VTYTSREQIEVYRFSLPVAILVPLLAVFLQAFLPFRFAWFSIFDLPLLVIFFAMARRTRSPVCLPEPASAFCRTRYPPPYRHVRHRQNWVGYGASSLGVKLDVESVGTSAGDDGLLRHP
jgi:rod shape-determining protein MreD